MNRKTETLSLSTLMVLAMTAVVPLAVATGFSNFERARHIALVVFAALALFSWGGGLIRRKQVTIASPGTLAIGGTFCLLVIGSLAWSGGILFGVLSVLTWLSLGVVFLVLAAPVGRPAEFLDWTTAVGAGAIGAGGLGLYEFFGGAGLTPYWDPAGVAGGFDSMAFATAYYVLVVPLLVASVGLAKGLRRWFMALALLLAALHLGLVIDGLALAIWVAVMGVVAIAIHMVGSSEAGGRLRLTSVATLLAVAVVISGAVIFDRPEEPTVAVDLPRISTTSAFEAEMAKRSSINWWYFATDRTESPLDQRYRPYLNSVARGLWEQEPLLGHGAGGWWLTQTDVVHDGDPEIRAMFERYPAFKSPHSDYARVMVEQGALGLVLFLLLLAGIMTAIVGGARAGEKLNEEERIVHWALATAVITGMVLMAFIPVLELASSGVIWVGAAALAVVYAARRDDGSPWLAMREVGAENGLVRYAAALMAVSVAVAIVYPAALHGKAALERGEADHLMLQSRFNEAIPLYQQAHETYPAHPEVLYNVAKAYQFRGDTLGGKDAIEEALEMRPYDARFLSHAGHVALRDHRITTGLELGREAVRTGPNYSEGYEVYASGLQRRGRYQDSAVLFETLLDREPPRRDRGVLRTRYAILLAEHLHEPEKALEQFELALQELPSGAERELIADRIEELTRRIKRKELEEQGKPIPPELHPDLDVQVHDHDHDHDHGHGHGHDDHPFHHHDPTHHVPGHDHDHDHDHDHGHDHDHEH